jgi:hypothetical protein
MTTNVHTPGVSEKEGHSNNNRDAGERQGRSISPIRRVNGDGKSKSKSPMRQNNQHQRNDNKSRSPTRNNNNKSRSPTRRHYNNKSKSPIRRKNSNKNPADMTVIVNRCDLWDSAAHFQPDECFQLQNQYPVARVLPYQFSNDDTAAAAAAATTTTPSNEVVAPSHPSVTVARVPHRVESVEFPVKKHDECEKDQHRCNVIDTSIPNPHDPNVVHDKYWCQRR